MPTVVLLRHGQSTANARGVLAGWSPETELNETGRQQAEEAAKRITASCDPVRLVASPLTRCQQTAAPLASALGQQVETDEGIAECRYGAWTGRSLSELAKEPLWATVQAQPSAVTFPDGDDFPGESMVAMAARAAQTVRRIDAEVSASHGDAAIWVAVSHGDIIKAILADALGMGLDQFQRIMCAPGSLSVIRYTAQRPFVVTMNVTGELPGLRSHTPTPDAVVGGESGQAEQGN